MLPPRRDTELFGIVAYVVSAVTIFCVSKKCAPSVAAMWDMVDDGDGSAEEEEDDGSSSE